MHPAWAFYWWCRQYPAKAKHLADKRWLEQLVTEANRIPPSAELKRAQGTMIANYPRLGENDLKPEAPVAAPEEPAVLELPHLAEALAEIPSRPA
jgi:hypothetical protein